MKTLNQLREFVDKLLLPSDLDATVTVVSQLPVASAEYEDQFRFLNTNILLDVDVGDGAVEKQFYASGKIYRCRKYKLVQPSTGLPAISYKWFEATFKENGALSPCEPIGEWILGPIVADNTCSVTLKWSDPANIVSPTDPSENATWAYTVIVRKNGSQPQSMFDGEIVAYSSKHNQYSRNGFIDVIPAEYKNTMKYNIFAVTRYSVATGMGDTEVKELNWTDASAAIASGKAGSIFPIGSVFTVHHATLGDVQMRVVAIDRNTPAGKTHSVTLMSDRVYVRGPYDLKELAVATTANPADGVAISTDYKASVRGNHSWEESNLRQWMNGDGRYSEQSAWDVVPDTSETSVDARYVDKNGVQIPSLIGGFATRASQSDPLTFGDLIQAVPVQTVAHDYTTPGAYKLVTTTDKCFIPSLMELRGSDPTGYPVVDGSEGTQFTYFRKEANPEDDLLDLARSIVIKDPNGACANYWLRTMETIPDPGDPSKFIVPGASGVYTVNGAAFTSPPGIYSGNYLPNKTVGCHYTAIDRDTKRETTGNLSSPGIVFCVVISNV